ncbi:MAG: hypothetical protein NZ824_10670 [Candidatus Thioglobus sp.]|nr:hypothetical protein [Candidatus Thioglobus sp.]
MSGGGILGKGLFKYLKELSDAAKAERLLDSNDAGGFPWAAKDMMNHKNQTFLDELESASNRNTDGNMVTDLYTQVQHPAKTGEYGSSGHFGEQLGVPEKALGWYDVHRKHSDLNERLDWLRSILRKDGDNMDRHVIAKVQQEIRSAKSDIDKLKTENKSHFRSDQPEVNLSKIVSPRAGTVSGSIPEYKINRRGRKVPVKELTEEEKYHKMIEDWAAAKEAKIAAKEANMTPDESIDQIAKDTLEKADSNPFTKTKKQEYTGTTEYYQDPITGEIRPKE